MGCTAQTALGFSSPLGTSLIAQILQVKAGLEIEEHGIFKAREAHLETRVAGCLATDVQEG
jgi:hypothetical protein